MIQKRFEISLDIKRPTSNREFEVVEGDNGNILEVTLTDDGEAVNLSGCRVLAVFSTSKGAKQQDTDDNGVVVDTELTNKLTIELYTTSFAPGLVECELQVYSGTSLDTLVTTAKFNFSCRRGIANDDVVQSTEEWPLLVETLKRTEAVEAAEALRVIAEGERAAAEELREIAHDSMIEATALTEAATTAANAAIEAANAAASAANAAASLANTKAGLADTSATNANAKAALADAAATAANTAANAANAAKTAADAATAAANAAASLANTKAGLANDAGAAAIVATAAADAAASAANLAAAYADEQGDYAKVQGDYAKAQGDLAAAIIASGITWATLPGKPESFPPSTHTHDYAASSHTHTLSELGAAPAADVDALEAADTLILLSGTGPAFTTSEPLPAAGQKRTLKFPAAATSATVAFATGGAKNVYAYGTTAFRPKANQVVEVVYDGTNFTVCSAGGGVEIPATPEAGDTAIYTTKLMLWKDNPGTSYILAVDNSGSPKCEYTIHKSGVYRIKLRGKSYSGNTYYCLYKNGSAIPGSEITSTSTQMEPAGVFMDISLAAGDVVQVRIKGSTSTADAIVLNFDVMLLASELQSAFNEIITQNA